MSSSISTAATSTATSLPGAPTDQRSPAPIPTIPAEALNLAAGTPYCQFNFPTCLANLSTSRCDGNEVHVWENCTQFCQLRDGDAWASCVSMTVPGPAAYGTACGKAPAAGHAAGQAGSSRVGWVGKVVAALAILAGTGP